MTRRIIVVGYGMAGHHLVARLLQAGRHTPAGDFEVTVLGAESGAPYNRVLLPEVLAGRIDQRRIDLSEPDDPRVTVRAGVRATEIDRERRLVHGDDGSVLPYDDLVLATGANPVLPPLGGIRDEQGLKPGVHTLRTLVDLDRIQDQLTAEESGGAALDGSALDGSALNGPARKLRAVVVGGGLLGVQCARGLTLRGLDVVLIHQGSHLLDHRLDADAAAILARTARGLGIEVHLECRARSVLRDREGRLTGVQLADGFRLDADLVLLACGSAPATGLAARAGLAVDNGILVDERLTSVTDPHVHAIGDCTRVHRSLRAAHGLAAPALEQAEVLAERLLGVPALYQGSSTIARLTATGVDVAILAAAPSLVAESRPDHVARTVRLTDPVGGTHRAVTVHGGRVVSSVLIGDVSAAARLTRLVDQPGPLPENPLDLLFDTAV
ncbi:NAD(P)/FAD-dependent oxidoreductase [Actinocrinis sp.]|uniref:NAD(P)/FAD-dependent oxidoreductase n=1 Tax=Actinocrinis sp. TaxID=1920516 RepID=UPI002D60FA22|nr:FAD-dependent oxidoreductase [Actinocrinis sp.]HZP53805.1 FAD-dependent oxidoreductase [Actinocrinis sp.]